MEVNDKLVNDMVATLYADEERIRGLRTTVGVMRATIMERTAERDALRVEVEALRAQLNRGAK